MTRNPNVSQVYGSLSLLAQVYSSKPDKDDSDSWPAYIFMVVSIAVIYVAVTLHVMRNHVQHCRNIIVIEVKSFVKKIRLTSRNSENVPLLYRCAYLLWYYFGLVFLLRMLRRRWRRKEPQLPI